jgi:uncharacterized membrane protein YeaQ/YmgE (transglycosylase-associated protein family)
MWLIYSALVGVVGGWLAGRVLRGNGFGLLGNIAAGILGAVVGGSLLRTAGINGAGAVIDILIPAAIGAAIILFVVHFSTGRRAGRRLWS